jgi:hypothetical protein
LPKFGFLFAAGIIGLCLVVFGFLSRRSRMAMGGAGLRFFIAYVFWVNIAAERDLALSPHVAGQDALSGTWVYRSAVLDLAGGNWKMEAVSRQLIADS